MIFLTKAIILDRISETDLNVLTEGVDAALDSPEVDAIQEVSSYLNYRYDTALIFAPDQDETDKIPIIRRITTDVLLYNLHSKVNPRNVPEKRLQLRDDAISWLKMVADPRSEVSADFLPKKQTEENRGVDISWGSKPKRNNTY
jgi:phage gp36-like protein